MKYEFIDKAVFFPEPGILVIGDLHIGYEAILRQSGVLVPERQVKDIIKNLEKIFKIIKNKKQKLKKIVFLGDIKHAFSFDYKERNEFQEIIEFLGQHLPEENIILIKGNHDTIDYTFEGKMKKTHTHETLLFLHGHEHQAELQDKKINTIVIGHLHPSVILEEGAKTEAYKCFLVGKYNGKEIIVMPSFLDFVEGTPVNYYDEDYVESFSIVPKKAIKNFEVHAIGKDKIYKFGKVKDL